MKRVLILSSHVAASRVGGRVSVTAMEARGIETVFVPTILLGRHPGHGTPGGGPVPDEQFGAMLEGVAAQGLFAQFDGVLTGYFASAGQVEIAAAAIEEIRKASPNPLIVADPIIGDDGKLYVGEEVAAAIRDHLVPLADMITPNAFELGWLSGNDVTTLAGFMAAAQELSPVTFMTSAQFGEDFGTAYHSGGTAILARHAKLDHLPNGTGDLLTAELMAALVSGSDPGSAFELAMVRTLDTALKARLVESAELPDILARQTAPHPDAMIDFLPLNA
ncbi:bifunctional hydroxymethylpyrimidine kinase/phosphomethylpyrimidine kinase [Hyphobacterium sp. HN65]|uniref:pyridoxal kinase n=1 Tax=Hyphobacterium lacteum TaxID=3116575 RepID=A0ABU7LTP7_9PROT|nr:bifunctional hydroxymethylpyrimidine kinase/phosphomethylpyrimidine kinase [Hyphobacterium sp. HN65]MEE2527300.1 bifunctional hydroxymethylpyrimidine kinase/phosphomethylpyrimidine kinase [Hyphobacterium sp. HN65]